MFRSPVSRSFHLSTLALGLLVAGLLLLPAGAEAGNHTVTALSNNTFSPATLTIDVGDSVTFTNGGGFHNVAADDGSFRCADGCDGQGGDGNPSGQAWSFTLTFNEVGSVPYNCEVHVGLGMRGTIIVEGNGGVGDPPGDLQFGAAGTNVNEGTGQATITVQRMGGVEGAVAVNYATSNGTASAGSDYTATSGTLSWPDGDDDPRTFTVPILDDSTVEGNETVNLALSSPTGGAGLGNPANAVLTIVDNDQQTAEPGSLAFSATGFNANENAGSATITVSRSGGSSGAVGVSYATSDGTANAGSDYTASNGTLNWADGDSADKSFTVPILDDALGDGNETVNLSLSSPTGGASLGTPSNASLLIDDDEVGGGQPLSGPDVRCDGLRLEGLLGRLGAITPNSTLTPTVNLSFTRSGDFAGIAVAGLGVGHPETHLAFSTNPEETTLLRNPARPQLAAVSASRNQTNSDLVPEGSQGVLSIELNPTLSANPTQNELLIINNIGDPVTREGGTPSLNKPGRGLAGLIVPCHGDFALIDSHAFKVLSKIARANASGAASHEIAIYRSEGPDTYRLDVYPIDPIGRSMGRLATQLSIAYNPNGTMVSGTLSVLPRCTGGQTEGCTSVTGFTELQLVMPAPPGQPVSDSPYKVSTSGTEGDGQPTSAVDFADLLNGSSWRAPI